MDMNYVAHSRNKSSFSTNRNNYLQQHVSPSFKQQHHQQHHNQYQHQLDQYQQAGYQQYHYQLQATSQDTQSFYPMQQQEVGRHYSQNPCYDSTTSQGASFQPGSHSESLGPFQRQKVSYTHHQQQQQQQHRYQGITDSGVQMSNGLNVMHSNQGPTHPNAYNYHFVQNQGHHQIQHAGYPYSSQAQQSVGPFGRPSISGLTSHCGGVSGGSAGGGRGRRSSGGKGDGQFVVQPSSQQQHHHHHYHHHHNNHQSNTSEKEFSLNINRIMQGLDRRTTLMIRNIPNKYTQVSKNTGFLTFI